jgi:hypothetical protein
MYLIDCIYFLVQSLLLIKNSMLVPFPSLVYMFLQVTGVGINTEWGLLMASISEDTGEETPLQVFFLAAISDCVLLLI